MALRLALFLGLMEAPAALAQAGDDPPGPYAVAREYGLTARMTDGTVLVADAYRPVTPERVPVLLVRTPRGRRSVT